MVLPIAEVKELLSRKSFINILIPRYGNCIQDLILVKVLASAKLRKDGLCHTAIGVLNQVIMGSVEKYWGFFLFHSILYLCIMNMLEQLARLVLPKEILDNFDIVKIETDESNIDSMSMTIHLDERMNAYLQKSEDYESKGFMDAVRITDFPIRDHKVILVLRRRRWRNKETGETFVDRISVTESGTRYSKEFAAFLKETYGHIPDDLPYA